MFGDNNAEQLLKIYQQNNSPMNNQIIFSFNSNEFIDFSETIWI